MYMYVCIIYLIHLTCLQEIRESLGLEALPGMHCNSFILSISRDAPSLFD